MGKKSCLGIAFVICFVQFSSEAFSSDASQFFSNLEQRRIGAIKLGELPQVLAGLAKEKALFSCTIYTKNSNFRLKKVAFGSKTDGTIKFETNVESENLPAGDYLPGHNYIYIRHEARPYTPFDLRYYYEPNSERTSYGIPYAHNGLFGLNQNYFVTTPELAIDEDFSVLDQGRTLIRKEFAIVHKESSALENLKWHFNIAELPPAVKIGEKTEITVCDRE